MRAEGDPVIRASEIGQYVFCARAWWLGRVLGYRSTNLAAMRQGAFEHRMHGRAVRSVGRLRAIGLTLAIMAVLLLLAWVLLRLGFR